MVFNEIFLKFLDYLTKYIAPVSSKNRSNILKQYKKILFEPIAVVPIQNRSNRLLKL